MKRQNFLKSTLCLLLTLLCNVAWAQPKASPAPVNGQWAEGTTWYQVQTKSGFYLRGDNLDANGNDKFECIVNNSQIPGLPMPGTYQYGRAVRIINKEDFSPVYKNKAFEKYLETLAACDINVTKLP